MMGLPEPRPLPKANLITDNTREFAQVPGLSMENWMPVTLTKGAKGLQVEHLAEKLCQLYWIHSADGSTVPWRRPLPT
jgi:hypothetical protein